MMGQGRHEREQAQQDRSGAQGRPFGPLTLGLRSQMGSDLVERHLRLPL